MAESNGITGTWSGLGPGGRIGLATGGLVIALIIVAGAIWSMQPDYRVLFSNLSETDAAAIVTELKRTKTVYRLADGGTTIRVPADRVYETRLALMSSGVPLSGGVGFEIFDKQGLGATEQSQRVSYQRALQGELARTIMANDQLKSARVHLVVEEGGLFSRDKAHPKAAVSVVLKPGAHLSGDQILGIQRLVAAAVPGLDASQVTITDQRGIALSTEVDADASGAPATGKLRLKKQADEYLTRKVSEVLDRAFGPGQAIVSVDATLNFDEIRRTDQNIVPLRGHGDEIGAVVRRRESIYRQPSAAGAGAATALKTTDTTGDRPAETAAGGTLTSTNEVEYELSKSGEQVLSTPGGIRRISVGVIVPQPLSDDQLARIRDIVSMAVGFNADRGDAISVEPLSRIMTGPAASPAPSSVSNTSATAAPAVATEGPVKKGWWPGDTLSRTVLLGGVVLLVGVVIVLASRRAEQNTLERRLSARERRQLLTELKSWLDTEKAATGGAPNR